MTLKEIEDSEVLSREDKIMMQMILVMVEGQQIIAENILEIAKHIKEKRDGMDKKTD